MGVFTDDAIAFSLILCYNIKVGLKKVCSLKGGRK
jgi:hypothetical protein